MVSHGQRSLQISHLSSFDSQNVNISRLSVHQLGAICICSWCDEFLDQYLKVNSLFQPVFHDWVSKFMVCAILSVGWCI